MKRLAWVGTILLTIGAAAAFAWPREVRLVGQVVLAQVSVPQPPEARRRAATLEARRLIAAAEGQVGVTLRYDPAYASLAFPGGDIPPERGVCTDVLIRALRDAFGIDLQLAVNRDMKTDFRAYPSTWGLTRTDANIDHRRVPNLETLLGRLGAQVTLTSDPADFLPGDIVTSRLPGNLPHIMIVGDRLAADGTLMVVHNIGAGARVEDALFDYPLKAHFRLTPEVMARLAELGR
ncbi:MAG: DUF1287 domain-containing protein [Paracoccaceae bacterium]